MARSLNKVMLIGNVGSDPEIRMTPSGSKVAKLSLATNRSYQDRSGQQQERTDWHRLTFFGRCRFCAWRGTPVSCLLERFKRLRISQPIIVNN